MLTASSLLSSRNLDLAANNLASKIRSGFPSSSEISRGFRKNDLQLLKVAYLNQYRPFFYQAKAEDEFILNISSHFDGPIIKNAGIARIVW